MSAAQNYMEAAGYAYTTLQPLMGPLDGYLIVHINFGSIPGVDVYVHHNDRTKSGLIAHKIVMKTTAEVDYFAATLQAQASIAA